MNMNICKVDPYCWNQMSYIDTLTNIDSYSFTNSISKEVRSYFINVILLECQNTQTNILENPPPFVKEFWLKNISHLQIWILGLKKTWFYVEPFLQNLLFKKINNTSFFKVHPPEPTIIEIEKSFQFSINQELNMI